MPKRRSPSISPFLASSSSGAAVASLPEETGEEQISKNMNVPLGDVFRKPPPPSSVMDATLGICKKRCSLRGYRRGQTTTGGFWGKRGTLDSRDDDAAIKYFQSFAVQHPRTAGYPRRRDGHGTAPENMYMSLLCRLDVSRTPTIISVTLSSTLYSIINWFLFTRDTLKNS